MDNMWDYFKNNPLRGAEYLGEIAKVSIFLNKLCPEYSSPDEAGNRARMAVSFANKYLRSERAKVAASRRKQR